MEKKLKGVFYETPCILIHRLLATITGNRNALNCLKHVTWCKNVTAIAILQKY